MPAVNGGIALLWRKKKRDEKAIIGSLGCEHHHRYRSPHKYLYIDFNANMGNPIYTCNFSHQRLLVASPGRLEWRR